MLEKLRIFREEKEKGFTLIELMVVILIIGILAAIAIPAFLNQRKSANDAALQSDLSNTSKVISTDGLKSNMMGTLPTALTANPIEGELEWGTGETKSKILLSSGSKIKVSGNYEGYCITGWNSGSNYDEEPLNYDSVHGGLLSDGVVEGGACKVGDIVAPPPEESNGGDGNNEASATLNGQIYKKAEWDGTLNRSKYYYTLTFNGQDGSGFIKADAPLNGPIKYSVSFLRYNNVSGGYESNLTFVNGEASFKLPSYAWDTSWGNPTDSKVYLEYDLPAGM